MLRRRHINGDSRGRIGRLASIGADLARWPFERVAWALERRLLWPLQRRFAGWGAPGHRAGAAALGAIGGAAILVAVLILPSGEGTPREQSAKPTSVAIVPAAEPRPQAVKPQQTTLHGVAPHFGVSSGKGVAKSGNGPDASASTGSGPGSSATEANSPKAATSGGEAAATTSTTAKVVPAGPAAMEVARSFSNAFVFYEIGEKRERAKAVFDETATEQLAEALDERPPRLPSNAKVPKAKVVNLVPGPRFGRQYTVSVSLLRVGVTSELRLTLQREGDGEWKVAQVLG